MIHVGTHRDYDNPPSVPMFGFNSKAPKHAGTSVSGALSCVAEGFMRALKAPVPSHSSKSSPTRVSLDDMGVSPIKCASLRSQYIEQLKQLHQLLKLTAVTKEEDEQQKGIILEKMTKMWGGRTCEDKASFRPVYYSYSCMHAQQHDCSLLQFKYIHVQLCTIMYLHNHKILKRNNYSVHVAVAGY